MSEEKEFEDVEEQEQIVEIIDNEGNKTYFIEEMLLPVGDKTFSILVEAKADEDVEDEEDEEENVIVAKVEFDKDGEPMYLDPTDEEYEQFKAAYEQMLEEEDAE